MSVGQQQSDQGTTPQLRTILLTDLVGSTALVERLGDVPASELFREHDRLVLELQQRWRGRLIDRSDGLLLLFERAIDGLGFALDYTLGLRAIGKARGVDLQARSGLHVGEVLSWKNSDAAVQLGAKPVEVEGLAKPMAARLMTMARPGQILISAMAEPLARRASRELGERGQNLLWKSYGRWRFKGIPEAHEIHEVGEVGIAPLRAPANGAKAWRDIPLWRRPAALAAELLLLAGLGVGGWLATRSEPAIAFAERDWVVVADLRNLTGQTVLDDSLEQAFRISLGQSRYVNVLSDMKARDTLERMQRKPGTPIDRAIASEIAIRDGARAVILPTVSEVGGRLRVSAEVIDPHSQATVYAESADGTGATSALHSIDSVTAVLREKLGEALAAIEKNSEPLPQVTTNNLDALRAFALGQRTYGQGKYEEALGYYQRAVSLDAAFALAHMGVLRANNAMEKLPEGVPSLRRAHALRARLPPRDQLYVEAWIAQVDAPDEALGKWMQMSNLYPEFFPAAANVGYALEVRNRYAQAIPYATRAASQRYEFGPISSELLGRMRLAQAEYGAAKRAFEAAAEAGLGSAKVWRAVNLASQQRFDEAMAGWPRSDELQVAYFERASMHLDQAQWTEALAEARGIHAGTTPGTSRFRQGLYPLAIAEWASGDDAAALATLDQLITLALASLDNGQSSANERADASLAAYAALLAQRIGSADRVARVVGRLRARPDLASMKPIDSLLAVLEAGKLRRAGDAQGALATLTPLIKDGDEQFQARVALMETSAEAGNIDDALSHARWLVGKRGRAYSEHGGCNWCPQALNVMDTRLARLRAAELLAAEGRRAEARRELQAFDQAWPQTRLGTQLRLRRVAVESTFN
jgi:putative peptide modification system cyclase